MVIIDDKFEQFAVTQFPCEFEGAFCAVKMMIFDGNEIVWVENAVPNTFWGEL